ncbi:MAG: sulfatase-like hydrolase/transferase [Acidobacteriota bacterium]
MTRARREASKGSPADAARASAGPWSGAVLLAAVAALLYVGLEWLFFVTKPSFMSGLSWTAKLSAGMHAFAFAFLLLFALSLPALLLRRWLPTLRVFRILAWLVPASAVACAVLLEADAFTVTLFHHGIASASGLGRWLYALFFLAALVWATRLTRDVEGRLESRRGRRLAAILLVAAGALVVATPFLGPASERPQRSQAASHARRWPNILILGTDGVDAARMSVYGSARQTTPFLEKLAASSLVFTDAFTNCGNTTGSLTALLTGRLPTSTGVVYAPDALRGSDCYRHLPGILRRLGYRTFASTVRYYADPYELDMLQAFDEANSRQAALPRVGGLFRTLLGSEGAFFLARTTDRLGDRLGRVLLGREMANPYREVTTPEGEESLDGERIASLFRFIDRKPGPFFAIVHLLGTHGPTFAPSRRVFSVGHEQTTGFQPEWLDDAILDFDHDVEEVTDELRRRRLLDDTVLVLYSDHGMGYRTEHRVPLIFRFPGGERVGHVDAPAQLADVAPTLLDDLGLPIPAWMDGRSLLRRPYDRCRWIIAASAGLGEEAKSARESRDHDPSLPWLAYVDVALCDRRYRFFTVSQKAFELPRLNPPEACGDCPAAGFTEVARSLVARLDAHGYDDLSLPALMAHTPITPVTRGEAAKALVAATHGRGFAPPPVEAPTFRDVPATDPAAPWIEQAARDGLFVGYPDGTFAPNAVLTREQMAIVVVSAHRRGQGRPPAASGARFFDVPTDNWAAPWIEELAREVADVSCAPRQFCPEFPETGYDFTAVIKALFADAHAHDNRTPTLARRSDSRAP